MLQTAKPDYKNGIVCSKHDIVWLYMYRLADMWVTRYQVICAHIADVHLQSIGFQMLFCQWLTILPDYKRCRVKSINHKIMVSE